MKKFIPRAVEKWLDKNFSHDHKVLLIFRLYQLKVFESDEKRASMLMSEAGMSLHEDGKAYRALREVNDATP